MVLITFVSIDIGDDWWYWLVGQLKSGRNRYIVTKTDHTETETAHTRHVYTNIKQKDNNENNEEKVNIGHR